MLAPSTFTETLKCSSSLLICPLPQMLVPAHNCRPLHSPTDPWLIPALFLIYFFSGANFIFPSPASPLLEKGGLPQSQHLLNPESWWEKSAWASHQRERMQNGKPTILQLVSRPGFTEGSFWRMRSHFFLISFPGAWSCQSLTSDFMFSISIIFLESKLTGPSRLRGTENGLEAC